MQQYQSLEPQIKELDAEMKETATWDHGHGDGRSADGVCQQQPAASTVREDPCMRKHRVAREPFGRTRACARGWLHVDIFDNELIICVALNARFARQKRRENSEFDVWLAICQETTRRQMS